MSLYFPKTHPSLNLCFQDRDREALMWPFFTDASQVGAPRAKGAWAIRFLSQLSPSVLAPPPAHLHHMESEFFRSQA